MFGHLVNKLFQYCPTYHFSDFHLHGKQNGPYSGTYSSENPLLLFWQKQFNKQPKE
jgi:hypothetical protein